MKVRIITFLMALVCFSCIHRQQKSEKKKRTSREYSIPKMQIKTLPDIPMAVYRVKGDFEKHPRVIEQLRSYLSSKQIGFRDCTGIYPDDPDIHQGDELDWKIGFEIPPDVMALDDRRYQVEILKGCTALVVESSVKNSAIHGLYCKVWLLEHNYVQVQPTRMVYHFDSEIVEDQHTTIIFPIKERTRKIPIMTNSTLDHKL